MSVLLPQAPRSCEWWDVQHLLHGGEAVSLSQFVKDLDVLDLPIHQHYRLLDFDPICLEIIQRDWEAAISHPRHNDEGLVRPIVHSMLQCAVIMADNTTPHKSGRRHQYLVLAEPIIDRYTDNRLSDEAIVEYVMDGEFIRLLLEVKGSSALCENFLSKTKHRRQPFCQLIQEVAMAYRSKMWKEELLCGIATRDVWFLFRIKDMSNNGTLKLRIVSSYVVNVVVNVVDPIICDISMHRCLSFITQYLCSRRTWFPYIV